MTDTTDQSRRAQKTPLPPDVLADALHDRTHENSGRLLHASPIVVSDNAALLRDLDSAAAGVQRLDRLDAEHIAKAIRALEAKVLLRDQHIEMLRAENAHYLIGRDRLAGEVERLKADLSRTSNYLALYSEQSVTAGNVLAAEVARLTSELAAAREALEWIADNTGRDTWLSQFERRFDRGDVDDLMAAINAARRAGEGEK